MHVLALYQHAAAESLSERYLEVPGGAAHVASSPAHTQLVLRAPALLPRPHDSVLFAHPQVSPVA